MQSDIRASGAHRLGRALLSATRALPHCLPPGVTAGSSPAACIFHCFHCSSHCFSIDTHCSWSGDVSLGCAITCIANGAHFPLQIACIFVRQTFRRNCLPGAWSPSRYHRGQKRSADRDIGDICEKLGLFCADRKTVASNSILQALIVLMDIPFRDATGHTGSGNRMPFWNSRGSTLGQIKPETGSANGYWR